MGVMLLIVAAAWFFWNACFRKTYIIIKYKNPKPIKIPNNTEKEEVYKALNEKLNFPEKKSIFFDEYGNIVIECKYGNHPIIIEDNCIFVGRETAYGEKHTEEAEVLDAYIRKIYDINAPVNPNEKYKKMKNYRKNWILIQIAMVAALLVMLAMGSHEAGIDDAVSSNFISSSYLTQYSEEVTIGEAFDAFFADGSWETHSDGAMEYIDYSGNCLLGEEDVNVVIRFWKSDEQFKVENVFINGNEISVITETALFEAIYNNENR